jgi:uncharacterized protein
MPEFTRHEPGTFCWIELAAHDANAARRFYTELFGWTVNEVPMGDSGFYYILEKNGKAAAALYEMMPDMRAQGMPANWMSYVAVASADDATAKAKALGGTVMAEPMDVFDFGRMAVLFDSQGAAFSVWEPKTNIGVQIRDEDDTLCWNEIHANDLGKAKEFYTSLFGWNAKESPQYTEWSNGDTAIGGMIQSHTPQYPSFWMPYFAVTDCDAKVATARAGGAKVYVEPNDIPGVGRFSVLADPAGAVFSVIKLDLGEHG